MGMPASSKRRWTTSDDELTWHPAGVANPLRIDLSAFFAAVIAKLRRPT